MTSEQCNISRKTQFYKQLSEQSNKLCEQSNELSEQSNELSKQSNKLSEQSNKELSDQSNYVSEQSNEPSEQSNKLSEQSKRQDSQQSNINRNKQIGVQSNNKCNKLSFRAFNIFNKQSRDQNFKLRNLSHKSNLENKVKVKNEVSANHSTLSFYKQEDLAMYIKHEVDCQDCMTCGMVIFEVNSVYRSIGNWEIIEKPLK